jgi:hypothetical protein
MFDIQLFGLLEVRTRGIRLAGDDFGGERARHLLALLALRGDRSFVELSELLRVPVATVKDDLAVLRDRLEPGVRNRDSVITGKRNHLWLAPERVRVDVATCDQLINAAAGRTAERAARPLTAAAHLATRPLLEDVDTPWAAEARGEYRAKLLMSAQPVR